MYELIESETIKIKTQKTDPELKSSSHRSYHTILSPLGKIHSSAICFALYIKYVTARWSNKNYFEEWQ